MLALGFASDGVFMLLAPQSWFQVMTLPWDKSTTPFYFIRMLGVADITMALLFFWCARNLKKRRPVHLALTLYVVGVAVVSVMEGRAASYAGAVADLILSQGLPVFLALVMLVMALPPLPVRVKGPREQGQVKWFNATKGFGFITRGQGEDIFVHYRSIRGEGHRTLREGQPVEFVVIKGEKGLQAEDVQPW
jgi:cold shock CspA family protein